MEVFCYLETAEIGGVIFNETAKQQTFFFVLCVQLNFRVVDN